MQAGPAEVDGVRVRVRSGAWARALAVAAALVAAWLLPGPGPAAAAPALVAQQVRVPLAGGPRQVTFWLPPDFKIEVAASGLPNARMLAQSPTGELVLSQHAEGRVVKLADRDGDGSFEDVVPILSNLDVPHGVAFVGQTLYVAETDQILRLDRWWDGSSARPIASLPGGGHHQTRTLVAGPDGALYVSVGSSCDVCVEASPLRATISRLDPAEPGGRLEPVARGLRNAVGLTFGPDGTTLWATENERNELGDADPPDEIVRIRPGGDYGWPACLGDRRSAPGFGSAERCAATEPPTVALPAHIAPLGLAFYPAGPFPERYHGDLFVALHGSALRDDPVGYEVARVAMEGDVPVAVETFIRGWLVGDDSWGRPVAPFVAPDGSLLITDDKAGLIFRVRPVGAGGSTRGG